MKFVVSSDWHLDHVTMGVRRFDDVAEAVLETISAAEGMKADGYFFLGDLADPDKNLTVFRACEFAVRMALRLQSVGIPSFWLAGNHDVIDTNEGTTTLSPLRPLEVATKGTGGARIAVLEEPRVIVLPGWPRIVSLPFTSVLNPYDPEEFVTRAKGFTNDITIGHLTVPGVVPGEETTDMPRGRDVLFPIAAAKERSAIMMNGHYHRQQTTPDGIHIPGSLARLTATDGDNKPGFLVIEMEG